MHFGSQALTKFHTSQKVTTKTGIEQEDALLNESAAKETTLTLHIMELENDGKQVNGPRRIVVVSQLCDD